MARELLGRSAEVGSLARLVSGRGPTLSVVRGSAGAGKSALVRGATAEREAVRYTAPDLPDGAHREAVRARLGPRLLEAGVELEAGADWPALLSAAGQAAAARPLVLALDGAHRLLSARGRLPELLAEGWRDVRAHARDLHLVLSGDGPGGLDAVVEAGEPLAASVSLDLAVGPLTPRHVALRFPAYGPLDRLRAWSIFGGFPAVWAGTDPTASLARNVRRTLLDPDAGPAVVGALPGALQSPARYEAILIALAHGAREWGAVVAAVPELDSGSGLAPYLRRLERLGLVRVERSLDAPARSRSRRYALADPFLAFRARFLLPHLAEIEAGEARALWRDRIRPRLDDHLARMLPGLARAWAAGHGDEVMPASAREVGGLWGEGYDLPVAGTLRNGAPFYGVCVGPGGDASAAEADRLADGIRATRWGFGREARHGVVFTLARPSPELLRRAARGDELHLVGPTTLAGG